MVISARSEPAWIVYRNFCPPGAGNRLFALSPQIADLGGGRVIVTDNASGDGSAGMIAVVIMFVAETAGLLRQ